MLVRIRGAVLEEYLLRQNVSRTEFARSAMLSGAYLAQLIGGKRHPSGRVRARLLSASHLDFDALFEIAPSD